MWSSVVPLRPLPHFIVDHLIYQISPLPSLFSVWFLLLFPSTSGDLFPHSPHYGRSDMVQISRFRLWESSRTLCPFWTLVWEPLDHMAKERGLWRAEELLLGVGTSSEPWAEAGVVVFPPLWPARWVKLHDWAQVKTAGPQKCEKFQEIVLLLSHRVWDGLLCSSDRST